MTLLRKVTVVIVVTLLVIFFAPIGWIACSEHGIHGYFDGGPCVCGFPAFIHITDDGYFTYSPGHKTPERKEYKLRPHDGGWDILTLEPRRLPPSHSHFADLEGEQVGRMRLRDGVLYQSMYDSREWRPVDRVYNVWRIWIPAALSR